MKVGNTPASWGVLEFGLEGETAGFLQVLDEMVQAGYEGTELGDWGFLPVEPEELKQVLHSRGLSLHSAFVPVYLKDPAAHVAGEEKALRIARLLSAVEDDRPFIVLADENGKDQMRTSNAGRILPVHGLSDAEWDVFATGAERIARSVYRECGLRTVFHHHCAGYVETPSEIERLMALTDPQVLGLCFDTGHYRFGGGDPLSGIQKYGNRIWLFHFKDFDPAIARRMIAENWDYFEAVRKGIFCELGKGDVDFAAALVELQRSGYHGWGVVEQDVLPGMGSPLESALRNRQYLRKLGIE